MFESFDVDRNGQINADELSHALAHYEYVHPPYFLPMHGTKFRLVSVSAYLSLIGWSRSMVSPPPPDLSHWVVFISSPKRVPSHEVGFPTMVLLLHRR